MSFGNRPGKKPEAQPQQKGRFGRPGPKPAERPAAPSGNAPVAVRQSGGPEGFQKVGASRVAALRKKFGQNG